MKVSKRSAAILLSRQPLRPSGKDAWVQQSVAAVRWVKSQELVLHTSVGMQTWELLTSIGSLEGVRQSLSIAADSGHEFERLKGFAIDQFDLNLALVDFAPVFSEGKNLSKDELWLKRDEQVVGPADVLLPVSLRKGGHMDSLLQRLRKRGKSIERRFQVDYQKRARPLAYRLKAEQLNHDLRRLEDRYLVHWTRAANCAWPTERLIDYYRAIVESESYPRSGFSTLMNIISTARIVATPKNMPAGIATVSFSGLPPADIVPLVAWRSRYRQMSFEPYGIGLDRQYVMSKGVCPVQYYHRDNDRARDSEQWLRQSVGVKGYWRAEQEYRYKGDFDFSSFASNRLLALCHTQREAEIIEKSTGIQAFPLITKHC